MIYRREGYLARMCQEESYLIHEIYICRKVDIFMELDKLLGDFDKVPSYQN